MQRQRGLTLLELLVVLAIIGLAMAGVSLSLRDSNQTQLEREAQRLVAVLEAARAQSRTSGIALIWQATPEGFVIRPALAMSAAQGSNTANPIGTRHETWLVAGTHAALSTPTPAANAIPAGMLALGPEPILAPVRITLSVTTSNSTQAAPTLSIGTDGLKPFQVLP